MRLLADLPELLGNLLVPRREGQHIVAGTAEENADDLKYLANLVAKGSYWPTLDRVFPFYKAIDAHCYAERPSQPGSVVISMDDTRNVKLLALQSGAMKDDA